MRKREVALRGAAAAPASWKSQLAKSPRVRGEGFNPLFLRTREVEALVRGPIPIRLDEGSGGIGTPLGERARPPARESFGIPPRLR